MSPRRYPERPIAGVGVVVWRGDELLLIRRGKAPRKGEWSLPGGAQDLGETVHETAIREVHEETGLEIEITGLIDVVDAIRHDGRGRVEFHYTLIDLAAEWRSGEARAMDDAEEVVWIRRDQIRDYVRWDETIRIIEKSAAMRQA